MEGCKIVMFHVVSYLKGCYLKLLQTLYSIYAIPQRLQVKQICSCSRITLTSPAHVLSTEIKNTRNQLRELQQSLKHLKSEQTKMLIFPTHTRFHYIMHS